MSLESQLNIEMWRREERTNSDYMYYCILFQKTDNTLFSLLQYIKFTQHDFVLHGNIVKACIIITKSLTISNKNMLPHNHKPLYQQVFQVGFEAYL